MSILTQSRGPLRRVQVSDRCPNMYVYVRVCVCVSMCLYVCVYIYAYRTVSVCVAVDYIYIHISYPKACAILKALRVDAFMRACM